MPYAIKSIFVTLQGEGFWAGTPAVFIRMAGCNLWSGRDQDRARYDAPCARFCDTDFVGGERLAADAIAERCAAAAARAAARLAVVTGGEPALQLDALLCSTLCRAGFTVSVETNGTVRMRCDPDWVTVSPKRLDDRWVEKRADELKVVYPAYDPELALSAWQAGPGPRRSTPQLFVQPQDGLAGALEKTVAFQRAHPAWRLSLQTHKLLGLP